MKKTAAPPLVCKSLKYVRFVLKVHTNIYNTEEYLPDYGDWSILPYISLSVGLVGLKRVEDDDLIAFRRLSSPERGLCVVQRGN